MRCLALSILALTFLAGCGGHGSQRSTVTPVRDPGPPLVNSDRNIFDGTPPVATEPDQGHGSGGGSNRGGPVVGIGNGGSGSAGGGNKGAAVPEPTTLLLVGSGLAAAAISRRRRKAAPAN